MLNQHENLVVPKSDHLKVGDCVVDIARREARAKGEAVSLATREFDLLAHLARNQGIALSRQHELFPRGTIRA